MKRYRKYFIIALAVIAFCVSICFIPFDASRFIPEVEKQVAKDYGINIHIEKLIFRFGPAMKVKAPIMHLMYEDGQKFGQFNNVKIFLPWSALFKKDDIAVKKLYADKFILKVNSKDKYLPQILEKFESKDFDNNPNITLKNYSMTYTDADKSYKISGPYLEVSKIINVQNMKLKTAGDFYINDKQYISYDLSFLPEIDINDIKKQEFDIKNFLNQMESLDFHSDIIADLKIYSDKNKSMLASGLINLDNISVLDHEKKSPKSFIYLTFLGNKVGILSNIYASADKKVYLDGMINNSQKPEIDLKVKTDKIDLSDLYKKVKLLADCSKFKGIDSVNGILNADFNLKGDLNKIKSSGFLKITDASVKASGVDIKKINSEIDFSNNVITISNAVGYVNDSPILLRGKIDKNIDLELLMSKVELKKLCPASFGIKNGIVSLDENLSGTLNNITHKENLQIENFEAQKDGNSINFSALRIDTNKEDIAYINNIAIKPVQTEIIKIPALKLLISRDAIKVPDTNIFMPNSRFKAKAELTNYSNSNLSFNVNIDGNLYSRDVKALSSHIANYPIKFNVNGDSSTQNIESQILLDKAVILDEPGLINFVSKFENNTLKIDDLSVQPFNGNFSNTLKSNLKGAKKIIVSGSIENPANPVFKNVRLYIPQQLNLSFMDTVAQIKGDVFINGKFNQPEIVGQIGISNLVNQYLQLSMTNSSLDFNKNVVVFNSPSIKMADSSMSVNSTAYTDISKGLAIKNLNLKSKYMNFDTILMYKDSPLFKMLPINVAESKLFAEKASMSIYGAQLYLSALTADFKLTDNVLSAKDIASEMFNGKLSANMDFNLKDEMFKLKMQARGVSAAPIFDIIAIKKDTVSGTMDFDADLKGNLTSKQSLNGEIKFRVHNGHMGTLGKLEHLLYAQNVVADNMLRTSLSVVTKAITLKDTGLFKYLQGDISMKDGVANIKMLQSQGPLMSLFIKGQYYPATDYAKLVVLGRLSDEVVTGLGAFGEFSMNKLMVMLTGEENNRLNIPSEDLEKLPQLPMKNTKEFRSVINGILEKPSSVILFNWISYSQKSYRQKDVPTGDGKVPDFIESLPY